MYYLWLTKNQCRYIIFYDVLCGLFAFKIEAIKHTDYIEENNPTIILTLLRMGDGRVHFPRIFFISLFSNIIIL